MILMGGLDEMMPKKQQTHGMGLGNVFFVNIVTVVAITKCPASPPVCPRPVIHYEVEVWTGDVGGASTTARYSCRFMVRKARQKCSSSPAAQKVFERASRTHFRCVGGKAMVGAKERAQHTSENRGIGFSGLASC